MTRKEVYHSIDTEREYQELGKTDVNQPHMIKDLHIGDAISAIQYNLDKAREEWYKGAVPHTGAMTYLRKVAGLCVQAGEEYGMPERIIL